jgi:hypothetical protein
MRRFIVKVLKITLPVTVVSVLVLAVMIELVVRATWDEKKGTPGFFIASDTRLEKLSSHYSGWYGGVPVRINNLGFRDTRDYKLDKQPNTFRILVLGDSVTFGHGSLYESTYPYLLESRLKKWRPEVDWQVWNLGVPGYNNSQELSYLHEVGATFQPDLVVVGFFFNDVFDNYAPVSKGRIGRALSRLKGFLSVHSYSYHLYKKAYLNLSARLASSGANSELSRNLEDEEALLHRVDSVANLKEQEISPVAPLTGREALTIRCIPPDPLDLIKNVRQENAWRDAISGLQRLKYPVVFFINIAPDVCAMDDLFYNGPTKALNDYFVGVLSAAAPTVSTYDAFYRYRPSQMPLAGGHSLGNSNAVKADTLFEFLKDRHLVPTGSDSR